MTASYLRLASQPGTGSGAGFEAYFMGTTSVVPGHIVQELCESRGGRPELSVLTSLLVSVDVKNY